MRRGIRIAALVSGILIGLFYFIFSLDAWPASMHILPIAGFLTQAAPGLSILIASVIAYKHPKAGVIIFTIIAVVFSLWFKTYRNVQYFITLSLPVIVVALLFYSSLPAGKNSSVN